MIDFTEIPYDEDTWELFARDFLTEMGFFIESTPDRGADAGKDMLVTEQLHGKLSNYRFRWLVSCKHFATSKKSVSEKHEPNILERIGAFRADGFIGFYSTIASSGLNGRLNALRQEAKIKDFRIFDGKEIEGHLVRVGYSELMMRYFPQSYKRTKPLHLVTDAYTPLECAHCGKDILLGYFEAGYGAVLVEAQGRDADVEREVIRDVYCACKGECDRIVEQSLKAGGLSTRWTDIGDLLIPVEYLRYLMTTMNRLRDGTDVYTDEAYKKNKNILVTIAQRVLRSTTDKERKRFRQLMSLPPC